MPAYDFRSGIPRPGLHRSSRLDRVAIAIVNTTTLQKAKEKYGRIHSIVCGGLDMTRSFLSAMVRASREMERAQRARIREAERQQRIMQREASVRDRLDRAAYFASREAETQAENNLLAKQFQDLDRILSSRVGQNPSVDFKKLFKVADERVLDTVSGLELPVRPVRESFLPKPLNIFIRWLPFAKATFRRKYDEATRRFRLAQEAYDAVIKKRSEEFRAMKRNAENRIMPL
jgi:hypothetical protein